MLQLFQGLRILFFRHVSFHCVKDLPPIFSRGFFQTLGGLLQLRPAFQSALIENRRLLPVFPPEILIALYQALHCAGLHGKSSGKNLTHPFQHFRNLMGIHFFRTVLPIELSHRLLHEFFYILRKFSLLAFFLIQFQYPVVIPVFQSLFKSGPGTVSQNQKDRQRRHSRSGQNPRRDPFLFALTLWCRLRAVLRAAAVSAEFFLIADQFPTITANHWFSSCFYSLWLKFWIHYTN